MITLSGQRIYPRNSPNYVEGAVPTVEDIAVGLARQSRFAGQTLRFYSVLCHSIIGAAHPEFEGTGLSHHFLLHDLGEAIISDVPTTWKPAALKTMEREIVAAFYAANNIALPTDEEQQLIDRIDYACLVGEAHALGHSAAETVWPISEMDGQMEEAVCWVIGETNEMFDSGEPFDLMYSPRDSARRFRDELERYGVTVGVRD